MDEMKCSVCGCDLTKHDTGTYAVLKNEGNKTFKCKPCFRDYAMEESRKRLESLPKPSHKQICESSR
jgi:hypothetical protein